jgi:hypothetical protein
MTQPRPAFLTLAAILLLAPAVSAQRVSPPPPATYDALVRYRIHVGGNQHIVLYREMTSYFESIGFKRVESEDPNEPADPNAERMSGTIPSGRVADLFREPHVNTVLLRPAGYRLPENPQQRVLVQLKLTALSPSRQRDLFYQALDKLTRVGLIEKVGYDNERFTRILGTIPAGDVDTLDADLRFQPAGWLTTETPVEDLPEPIRSVNPVRIVEVLPEPEGVPPSTDVAPPSPPPAGQEWMAKIAPDLRAVAGAEAAGGPLRFEVVLTHAPGLDDPTWHDLFRNQAGVFVEGRIGPVVSVLAPAAAIRTLATLPEVATLRPPRMATNVQVLTSNAELRNDVLAATGLDRLHRLGHRGAGVRVAVIDADFGGLDARLGREFPKTTQVIDMTAARNSTLLPDPQPPTPAGEPGRGTRLALAVRLAAPDAELVLIRVDPSAMYQLLVVARFLHGDTVRPESLVARNRELLEDNNQLGVEHTRLTAERQAMQSEFGQEEDILQRRRALEARTTALTEQEHAYHGRLIRFAALETGLADLQRVNVVVCPLAWDEGYPFDGSGPLSRYLDDVFYGRPRMKTVGPLRQPQAAALWFQAAGNTRGQVWNGPLLDADGSGAFEFAPTDLPIPAGRWSREVNFLAWQAAGAERTFDLPAGARVRLTFQWTEAHEPAVSNLPGPDLYRAPLAKLHLLVLRQRDPSGTKVATDDFNVIARSDSLAQLIEHRPNWATYEDIVEFTADAPGRFAVRLEGTVPPTTRPASVPSLPILDRAWEARVRLFVDTTGAAGRAVIGDYQPGLGGLGAPGNALLPRTVGAADSRGRPQPYSAGGPPAGQQLLIKPRFLAFDELNGVPGAGTEQSTAFAAGMYASMMSAGTIESQKLNWLDIAPGGVLHVPPVWLEQLERRWPKTGRE